MLHGFLAWPDAYARTAGRARADQVRREHFLFIYSMLFLSCRFPFFAALVLRMIAGPFHDGIIISRHTFIFSDGCFVFVLVACFLRVFSEKYTLNQLTQTPPFQNLSSDSDCEVQISRVQLSVPSEERWRMNLV